MLDRMRAWVLDLCFPNRCDCCHASIPYDAWLCADCLNALSHLQIPNDAWATQNHVQSVPWQGMVTAYAYTGIACNGVLALKNGKRGFSKVAASALAARITECAWQPPPTCITWVPVPQRRRRIQGDCHSERLARDLASILACPVRGDLLRQIPSPTHQHELTRSAREAFANDSFYPTRQHLSGDVVLLCDDIMTTGSTIQRCTNLLLSQGARAVYLAIATCGVLEPLDSLLRASPSNSHQRDTIPLDSHF